MSTQKNKLKDILSRTVIPTDGESSKHISEYIKMICSDIDGIIETLKNEYGIETNRDELMLDIKRVDSINPVTKQKEINFQLVIHPTQELLKKFAKNYPELVV